MGCPFCKHRAPAPTGVTAYDYAVRKFSTPRRVSVVSQPTWMNSHKGSIGSDSSQPPIYFLSGTPALPVYATPPPDFRGQPPKKAPRVSGFKDSTLSAVPALPSRPPRKVANGGNTKKRLKLSLPNNTLAPPQKDEEDIPRTPSSVSLPQEIALPDETAQRLENYLKKNQSFSSIHILLNELQAQSNMDFAGLDYDTEEDDEHWSPTCADLGVIPLPTSRRHSTEKAPPVQPSRKKRSLMQTVEPLNAAHAENKQTPSLNINEVKRKPGNLKLAPDAAGELSPVRSPSRLSPFDLRKFSSDDEAAEVSNVVPCTPGPWFDRDGRSLTEAAFLKKQEEDQMVTPPPSENEESDDEPLSPVIAHSILLKVLRGLSTEGVANNPLISRRGSAGNISLSGLSEFIRTLQQQPPDLEEEENLKSSPSMADLQMALADLLDTEKSNEKHVVLQAP